jgi:ferredoxin-NADP reductase
MVARPVLACSPRTPRLSGRADISVALVRRGGLSRWIHGDIARGATVLVRKSCACRTRLRY